MVNIRKTRLVWTLAVLFGIASLLIVVGRSAHAETLGFTLSDDLGGELGGTRVLVLDDQTLKPLADAQVQATIVGGTPSITVTKKGYASATIIGAQSKGMIVYLKELPTKARNVVASGKMKKWTGQFDERGSTVHAGLVVKSLSAFDLLDFESGSVISPLKDTIDVFGDREIPSNLMFPEQDVFLLFGSITLNKENYRLPVRAGEPSRLVGLQGEFSVDDVLPAFQGGKMSLAILNKVKFKQAGLTSTLVPTQDFTQIVDANQALSSRHKVSVNKPPFAGDVLVVAATDTAGDRNFLMPTDIKLAINKDSPNQVNTVNLMAPSSGAPESLNIMTIAMSDKGRQLSGILTEKAGSSVRPGDFLGTASVETEPRALPETIAVKAPANGIATAVFQSNILGDEERAVPVWYVYTLPNAGEVAVPTQAQPGDVRYPIQSYAVVQLDLGQGFDEKKVDGETVLRRLQRFSRVSAKITP